MSGADVRVARLRVSPVKGLAQSEVDALELSPDGVRSDRRFVVTDEHDRRQYSVDFGPLRRALATWDEETRSLSIALPDGPVVAEVVELEDDTVRLGTPSGRLMLGRGVRGPFAGALSRAEGRPLRLYHVPVGHGSPGPVTILGDGSVARLARELGVEALDSERFKMTIELSGLADAEEDGWQGARLRVGETALAVGAQVPRCALTTYDPATGMRDHDTLRVLLDYRGALPTGEPPLGVYASVVEAGVVCVGDGVEVEVA